MATIKFKRGSGQPTGLTAYEPAWDTVNNRFFIHNGSTALWVGAAVIQDVNLTGNCAWTIPTQNSVKTYVDNRVAGGAVSSVDGVTGAVDLLAGSGISITNPTGSFKGITLSNSGVLSVNGSTGTLTNIAVTNAAQSFTGLQSFLSGISSAGATISTALYTNSTTLNLFNETAQTINFAGAGKNIIIANGSTASTLTIGSNIISFNNNVSVDGIKFDTDGQQLVFAPNPAAISGGSTPTLTVEAVDGGNGLVKVDGGHLYLGRVTNASSLVSAAGIIFEGAVDNTSETFLTVAKASTDRTITLPDDTGTVALTKNIVSSVNGLTGAITTVSSLNGATGAVTIGAGTGISIATSTEARGITVTNIGVTSLAGTANQITASGSTGAITLSLPSAITVPGSLATTTSLTVGTDLTVTGNLTVNGTSTTVNSTTVTVQDPIISMGGLTGNAPPVSGDTKDRGFVVQYRSSGDVGVTGFFGIDRSLDAFAFYASGVTLSGEVVTSGNFGVGQFSGLNIIDNTSGFRALLRNASGTNSDRTFTFPNHTGTILAPSSLGTSGFVLSSTGSSSQPTWIDPSLSGFTAYTALGLQIGATFANQNFNLVFATANSGYQLLYADTNNDLQWNPGTRTLTLDNGNGKLEGVVDGGGF